ncbi:hypothetical protein V2J09_017374, partial [Rumex salicifolius]
KINPPFIPTSSFSALGFLLSLRAPSIAVSSPRQTFLSITQNDTVFARFMKPLSNSSMKIPWSLIMLLSCLYVSHAQKYDEFGDPIKAGKTDDASVFGAGGGGGGTGAGTDTDSKEITVPKAMKTCDGIYIAYNFMGREKSYPMTRNVTAQSWAFQSQLQLLNMGSTELRAWQVFVGFQHHELIVSMDGGQLLDADDFPTPVQNGTTIVGSDLRTAIDTANDMTQMSAQVTIKGTQFGLGNAAVPMPKSLKLVNEGFKCPAPTKHKTNMQMCCRKDKKFKIKPTKINRRRNGDLTIAYDVLQAFGNNYQAQVTIDNNNPLGRLDHWNLTWDWMRGEFIYSIRGAYTNKKDPSTCIYGPVGQYYGDMDFTQVVSCHPSPIIMDLPREKENDDKIGKLPYCCRNGTILPKVMNVSEARTIFQLQVFKVPPDMKRTALFPPQNWRISGVVNPHYRCGPAIRVSPSEFPDPNGLSSKTLAVASWQVVCNITRPKPRQSKCCVSFSSYYNASAIPCNTCACGCANLPDDYPKCNANSHAMLLPPEALLVPFENRTKKAVVWARMKHHPIPKPLPCPDNCGVSINWHLLGNYKDGWTARITLFNWGELPFENWFTALQMGKSALGFEKAYSFNGTQLTDSDKTIFLQGLKGMNYLIAETNGSSIGDPRVPGKQQTVISFKKKIKWKLNILKGDGFPKKVIFNGEECALPWQIPTGTGHRRARVGLGAVLVAWLVGLVLVTDRLHWT